MLVCRRIDFAQAIFAAIAAFFLLAVAGCARKALPEAGSPAEHLYAIRCGQCHQAYNPRSMTAAMWAIQVNNMKTRIAQAGYPPLSADEEKTILDYLTRNAGSD